MSIVCSNRPSPHLFMRGLDFPYKKRTQIRVKTAKIAIKLGPGSGGRTSGLYPGRSEPQGRMVRLQGRTVQAKGENPFVIGVLKLDGSTSESYGPTLAQTVRLEVRTVGRGPKSFCNRGPQVGRSDFKVGRSDLSSDGPVSTSDGPTWFSSAALFWQ